MNTRLGCEAAEVFSFFSDLVVRKILCSTVHPVALLVTLLELIKSRGEQYLYNNGSHSN